MSGKASASKRKSQQLKRTSKQRAAEDGDLPDNEVIKYQIYHLDPLIRNTITFKRPKVFSAFFVHNIYLICRSSCIVFLCLLENPIQLFSIHGNVFKTIFISYV